MDEQRYLPIGEHGLIGNLRTVALVGTDGTIDWCCIPRFDSPSVFASILDRDNGGFFQLTTDIPATTRQFYFPDTNVLITRFLSEDGVAEIQDYMPVPSDNAETDHHRLIRRVRCVRGELPFRAHIAPRFDYGLQPHTLRQEGDRAIFESASLSLSLNSTAPFELVDGDVISSFRLKQGESEVFCLERADTGTTPIPYGSAEEAEEEFTATVAYWRRWLSQSRYRGRWREAVHRSALTLKLMTYAPTGAIVASPTTSLPERLGGSRNWDYRYVWVRDAAFCTYSLLRLGFTEEADAFMGFLAARVRESDADPEGPLQIMYRIDGSDTLSERRLDHFEGYEGSSPVRVGNDAVNQLQLDIYGALVDSIYLYNKWGQPISSGVWEGVTTFVEWVCKNWDQPDEGVWETRGGRRNFLYSRLMCWVAIERAIRVAHQRGLPADLVRWSQARDAIYHQIMDRFWDPDLHAFVQHRDGHVLDASVLMMPLSKFIAPSDPKWLSTLDLLGDTLVSDSLVYRYDPHLAPDGLEGEEGTMSICTFWYVEALSRAGQVDEARLAFEKMITYANHLGLYAEQLGPTGEHLGNFPQAFTHLALISAAFNIDRALG